MPNSFKNQTITTTKRETKMKKALLALLSAVLLITVTQPAQAEDQKVLAIIDTAIDSKQFPQVIYEACFTQNKTCPNNTNLMEGPGSASAVSASSKWPTTGPQWMNNDTYHGQSMVKAAIAVNPNVKIVFVRYANVTPTGDSVNPAKSLVESISWVSKNADKYSIDALSISQAAVDTINLGQCSTDKVTIGAVASLNSKNIPVFAATGNHKRTDVVGFPSCITGVIGVGALANATQFDISTNRGPGLDLLAFGKISITKVTGHQYDLAGTSGATVVSASSYLAKNTYKTFQEYLNALPKILINNVSYSFN